MGRNFIEIVHGPPSMYIASCNISIYPLIRQTCRVLIDLVRRL